MKTKILKKLLIVFSVLAMFAYGIVYACSDDGYSWYGISDFAPENFSDAEYKPFLFEPYNLFYDFSYDIEHISRFSDEIVSDWSGFLKNKAKEQDIRFLILDEKSKETIEALFEYTSKNIKNSAYNAWSGKLNLNDTDIKEFIEFLYLAKQVELCSVTPINSWYYEEDTQTEVLKVKSGLISQIEQKYQSSTNKFLKNRYWFQTIKAYFYAEVQNPAISFFEKTKSENPKNTLYYRALSYIAGIEYKAKNFSRSNYLYSVVFDQCVSLEKTAIFNFHPQEEADWNQALALAKTNDEKAALWALLGYYVDEQRAIDEIFKLNPKSKYLDFLLTRLINKQETNIAEAKSETVAEYRAQTKAKLNEYAYRTVLKIASTETTAKPYFWNMAAGYLSTFYGDYAGARTFLEKAEKQIGQDATIKAQLRLFKFVNNLSEISVMNQAAENKLLNDLNWILLDKGDKKPDVFRTDRSYHWSKKYISALYKSANNIVFAELFSGNADYSYYSYGHNTEFYRTPSNIEAMKTFLEKPNKTPFEVMASEIYGVGIDDIYAYQAVMSTFKNEIDNALVYMSKAKTIKDNELFGNPFNGNIQDCHDCDHIATQKTKFSKYRFLEVIQIMQNKIKAGEDLYNNYLLLGNAFYNITHHGNARFFYEGIIIGSGMSMPSIIDEYYRTALTDMKHAKMYYQKAFEAATTNEQKAKCAYMLAKCERNEYYNNNFNSWDGWSETQIPDFLAWDGFKKLKTQYSDTKYYKDVLKECDYFAKYAGN